jgi:hypothetical protein
MCLSTTVADELEKTVAKLPWADVLAGLQVKNVRSILVRYSRAEVAYDKKEGSLSRVG